MAGYQINLETFLNVVEYNNSINIFEANPAKHVNFENKNEVINSITWFIKELKKQKEKEISRAYEKIANIMVNLDSDISKINAFTKNFIKLSEAILLSDQSINNIWHMTKEEAIYVSTKYIYKSNRWFQIDNFINSSEMCHYYNLMEKGKNDFKTKIDSISSNEKIIKLPFSDKNLWGIDPSYAWERVENDFKFLFDLYGENGAYSFIRKYEPELGKQFSYLLTKYNDIKNCYKPIGDIIQQNIELNNLDRSDCIYNVCPWDLTNIWILNVKSRSKFYKTLRIHNNLSGRNFTIKLPDFNLFLCRENFYIVDTLNFSIKLVISPFKHNFQSGIYYENCIYLFERNKILAQYNLYKYNLVWNNWTKLTTLNEDLKIISCAIYKNSILIASFSENFIYKYDINIESYSLIPVKFSSGIKHFIWNAEKIFIINERDKIYEIKGNEYGWKPVRNIREIAFMRLSYLWKENIIYIGFEDCTTIKYYTMKLKEKKQIDKNYNENIKILYS